MEEHTDDLWSVMYRTFILNIIFAQAIGFAEHVKELTRYKLMFEKNAGKEY